MKPQRVLITLAMALLAGAQTAEASSDAGGGAGGAVLEFVGLVLASGCFVVSWRVLAYVRGGRLASAWQWLISAFFLFAAGQGLAFLAHLMFAPLAGHIVIFLRIVGLIFLLVGMIRMRKALA